MPTWLNRIYRSLMSIRVKIYQSRLASLLLSLKLFRHNNNKYRIVIKKTYHLFEIHVYVQI